MKTASTWLKTALYAVGLNGTAVGIIVLLLIAGSTIAFLAFSISLGNTSSVSDLIGSIVAAATFVEAVRSAHTPPQDPTGVTVAFVLFFAVLAWGFGLGCQRESMRVTLWVLAALLLLGDGWYFVRPKRAQRP